MRLLPVLPEVGGDEAEAFVDDDDDLQRGTFGLVTLLVRRLVALGRFFEVGDIDTFASYLALPEGRIR